MLIAGSATQATTWKPLPIHGADVRSLAIDPSNPDSVFAGTSGGHVYWSGDGGKNWQNAGQAIPFKGWVVASLVFDPNRSGRIWAGLWGVWGSGLVAFSDDQGHSWNLRREGLPEAAVYALALVPGAPGRIFAATRKGVYGTEDDGGRWRSLSDGVPGLINVSSLLVDPYEPSTIFAGTWRRAYRSDDSGQTWKGIFEGMALDSEVFSLRAVPNRPGEIWASTCGWVYHSRNRGQTWTRKREGLQERRSPGLLAMPDGTLLTATVRGLYRSRDGGGRWGRTSTDQISVQSLAFHPKRPNRVLVGTEGAGVWVSQDRGLSWDASPVGMNNLRVDALTRLGNEVFAAVNHAGPFSGIYRVASDGEVTREEWPIPTVLDLAALGDLLFAGTEKGLFERQLGNWRLVREIGTDRIEQLAARGTRLVARTPHGLFEREGGPFRTLPFAPGSPKSVAMSGKNLWVGTGSGLFQLNQDSHQPISMPSVQGSKAGIRLATVGDELWLADRGSVWQRRTLEAPWVQTRKTPSRLLETGDLVFPLLVVGKEPPSWLYHQPSSSFLEISLPSAPWNIRGALVKNGQLLLATAGQGLLTAPVPALKSAEKIPAISATR